MQPGLTSPRSDSLAESPISTHQDYLEDLGASEIVGENQLPKKVGRHHGSYRYLREHGQRDQWDPKLTAFVREPQILA
jgi:hypothetical protein